MSIINNSLSLLTKLLPDYFLYGFNHPKEIYQMLQKADIFCRSNYIKGDYLEFGVGATSFLMANHIMGSYRHTWGFDSFEGLPEPTGIDQYKGKWKKSQYSTNFDTFVQLLHKKKFTNYSLVKGYFEQTLKGKPLAPQAAIVHIDSDLFESCKLVLKYVKPILQSGTVILFDDYYCFDGDPDKGEALAAQLFLKENQDINFIPYLKYHFTGNSFIVQIN